MSLHIFHNTTAEEAFSREACMIDAIGEACMIDTIGEACMIDAIGDACMVYSTSGVCCTPYRFN